ncbi:hypothetical protein EVAR_21114_1 [Eumeta japonica]|uniref:Uncharacterized protein n=1 Tax=Eumeta variegata TaxID=151549 RepID=A0A4C1VUB8_EUMVA|nr:hypothetical protein EVAR_21114_1 [Eumeta japonica]
MHSLSRKSEELLVLCTQRSASFTISFNQTTPRGYPHAAEVPTESSTKCMPAVSLSGNWKCERGEAGAVSVCARATPPGDRQWRGRARGRVRVRAPPAIGAAARPGRPLHMAGLKEVVVPRFGHSTAKVYPLQSLYFRLKSLLASSPPRWSSALRLLTAVSSPIINRMMTTV